MNILEGVFVFVFFMEILFNKGFCYFFYLEILLSIKSYYRFVCYVEWLSLLKGFGLRWFCG